MPGRQQMSIPSTQLACRSSAPATFPSATLFPTFHSSLPRSFAGLSIESVRRLEFGLVIVLKRFGSGRVCLARCRRSCGPGPQGRPRLGRDTHHRVFPGGAPRRPALTGDPAIAGKVVSFVLRRSVDVMPPVTSGNPQNWFFHNTLITLRRQNAPPPPPNQDLLITVGPTGIPAYGGFIRGAWARPVEQAEAFILHIGEHLNDRLLGVAMDLSTGAAGAHFSGGNESTLQTFRGRRLSGAGIRPGESLRRTDAP